MPNKEKLKNTFVHGLYKFEIARSRYGLCPAKTGFFQPFKSLSDVQQQIKTTLVSPIIALSSFAQHCIGLIANIVAMGLGILCVSPSLFITGAVDAASSIEHGVVTPLVACAVTLKSLVSLVTRTIATIFSFDLGESSNDLLSFLPDNPYKNADFSLN